MHNNTKSSIKYKLWKLWRFRTIKRVRDQYVTNTCARFATTNYDADIGSDSLKKCNGCIFQNANFICAHPTLLGRYQHTAPRYVSDIAKEWLKQNLTVEDAVDIFL